LILRFIALLHDGAAYKKPMKGFLNDFMAKERDASDSRLQRYTKTR